MYLSVQIPMEKNERLQAADGDAKFRLDGKGAAEEILVFRPLRGHEGLDIDIGQRLRGTCACLGFGFVVEATRAMIELRERAEGE
jgi:hypothetical protein